MGLNRHSLKPFKFLDVGDIIKVDQSNMLEEGSDYDREDN